MKVEIVDFNNKKAGEIQLDQSVFGLDVRVDILQRVVEWQRARNRAGTHSTKGISDIQGTTKKPYKQKGTGSARQGSLRSPQYRGGAVIFGPVVRSHAYSLPKKVRKLGLKTALSAKAAEGKLIIVQGLEAFSNKTKELEKSLAGLGLKAPLFVTGEVVPPSFAKAAANLKFVDVLPQQGANVYDILKHSELVLTEEAVKLLEERLK